MSKILDSWSPCLLAKNFHLAWVSVNCSLKTSLKIVKTPKGEDHWDVGLSFTSSWAPPSRWKIRVSSASPSDWPLTALCISEIQCSSTLSFLAPLYFPNLFSHGTETLTAGAVLEGPGVAAVVSGGVCSPNCPTCISRSFSLVVSVVSRSSVVILVCSRLLSQKKH